MPRARDDDLALIIMNYELLLLFICLHLASCRVLSKYSHLNTIWQYLSGDDIRGQETRRRQAGRKEAGGRQNERERRQRERYDDIT